MDTLYYDLEVKRVKVSGGADLLTLAPVAEEGTGGPAGEVLDFARCRRRLETKAAWEDLARAAVPEPVGAEPEAVLRPARRSRRVGAAVWLELAASAAVLGVALAAMAAFLRLV